MGRAENFQSTDDRTERDGDPRMWNCAPSIMTWPRLTNALRSLEMYLGSLDWLFSWSSNGIYHTYLSIDCSSVFCYNAILLFCYKARQLFC